MWRKGKRTPRWCARGEEKLAHLPIDGAEFRTRTIFDDASVMRKWAAIKSWRRHNKQDTPFCRMVPSFCSAICCLIPGLSYGQDWWCRVKIILHRIISVVWLTNFPSEIRRLTSPRWWAVSLFLSVKRCGDRLLAKNRILMIACHCLVLWQRKRCRLSGCWILTWDIYSHITKMGLQKERLHVLTFPHFRPSHY